MNHVEKIVKGSLAVFFISIVSAACAYFLRIYLARNLSVIDYGLFYAVLAFLSFFWLIKDLGIGQALARYIPVFVVKKRLGKLKKLIFHLYLIQILGGAGLFLFLYFFSEYLAINFFHNISAKVVIQVLAIEFVTAPFLKNIFQGFHRMRSYASIELFRVLLVFLILIIWPPINLIKVAVSYFFSSLIIHSIFLAYVFVKELFMKMEDYGNFMKKLYQFGIILTLGNFSMSLITYIDTLFLTLFRSLREVGLYQVAIPTSQLLWTFVGALSVVLLPSISELWAKREKSLIEKGLNMLLKFSFLFMVPVAFIFIAFPELAIEILFGNQYLQATNSLQILCFAAIFYTVFISFTTILTAIGKPKFTTKVMVKVSLLNFVLNFLLIPYFGIIGAATSALFSYVFGSILSVGYARRFLKFSISFQPIVKIFLLGFVMLFFIMTFKAFFVLEPIVEATICVILAFMFYTFFSFSTGVITKNDLRTIQMMNVYVPRILKRIVSKMVKK